jgi:predicted amidohydrolase YtcJ
MSDSKPVRAPNPAFFDHPAIDHLIAVTLELGAELWVQRERMRLMERLLAEKGLVTAQDIAAYQATPEETAELQAERDALVQRLYGILTRETVPATPKE